MGLLLGTLALALSWPIPWTHWRLTHDLNTRTETYVMIEPVAPSLPGFGPWVRAWDDLQSWLILHQVGVRHQEHKVFGQLQARRYPSRASVLGGTGLLAAHEVGGTAVVDAGRRPDLAGWPAIDLGTAGSGWYLGPLALIDTNGLNDPVVARSPYDTSTRLMGHEKVAPAGYVSCYRPNVCPALLISRRSDGAMVSVATPSPAWWMDMDVTAPEIPLPENLRGRESELIARAVFLVIDRDPPLTAAQVAGCVARDWSHSPPPHDEPWRTLQGLEAIAQRGAVVRARAREVHAGRG